MTDQPTAPPAADLRDHIARLRAEVAETETARDAYYASEQRLAAENARLRAEMERLRADRATAPSHLAAGIRAAADEIAGIDFHPKAHARALDLATGLVRRLRRLADEAQQPETVLAEEGGTPICVCEHGGLVCSACQQQPETEAAVCGDRYDESVCQCTPGHEGSHADWNRAWDYGRAPAPAEEPTR